MTRLLLIFFSACWVLLLFITKAKRQKIEEMFHIPKVIIPIAIVISSLLCLTFLIGLAPQSGDGGYYLGGTNQMYFEGTFPKGSGHELSLLFVYGIRLLVEHNLGLSISTSIYVIYFMLTLLYCTAIYKLVLSGTKNHSLALLSASLVPFSTLILWPLQSAVYAQFLSLSLFLLGASFYFGKSVWWKVSLIFALGTLVHIWTGLVFLATFGLYLLLTRLLKYKDTLSTIKKTFRVWLIPIIIILVTYVYLILDAWRQISNPYGLLYGYEFFRPNYLFLAGIQESPFVIVFAIFGLTTIALIKKPFFTYLYSVILFSSIVLFAGDFSYISRVLFLVPISIYVAFGIYSIWKLVKKSNTNVYLLYTVLLVLIGSVVVSSLYIDHRHFLIAKDRIPMETLDRIQEITETYGYKSYDIVIVLNPREYEMINWVEFLTGAWTLWYVDNFDRWYETYGYLEYDNWGRKIVMVEDSW